jgi:hypothetical protein
MSRADVPHIRRPFEAIRKLNEERKISLVIPSVLTDRIFKWFEDYAPAGGDAIGPTFTSTFYYDACFWKVEVPVVYGSVQLDPWDALPQMPPPTKRQLQRDPPTTEMYIQLWVDSVDYGLGMGDMGQGTNCPQSAIANLLHK